ncbi:MAG: response regulator [Myxococcota bacterium]
MVQREEKRKAPRIEMVLRVDYHSPQDLLSDYLTDLGEGGLFVCTTIPFDVGQEIEFVLSFPSLLEPLYLKGIVRWRRDHDSKEPTALAGVGVEFSFRDDAERRQIAGFLETFRQHERVVTPESEGPFQVLLVEDNPQTRELFEHALKQFHAEFADQNALEILSAKDGKAALQTLEKAHVDLALIDYFLPVLSGAQLIRLMRSRPEMQDIPILAVSVGGEDVRRDSLAAGADIFLQKPVIRKQLLATLRALVTARMATASQRNA